MVGPQGASFWPSYRSLRAAIGRSRDCSQLQLLCLHTPLRAPRLLTGRLCTHTRGSSGVHSLKPRATPHGPSTAAEEVGQPPHRLGQGGALAQGREEAVGEVQRPGDALAEEEIQVLVARGLDDGAEGAVDGASDAVSLIDSASSDVAASSRASCASRPAQRASSVALWRAAVWSAAISVSWCARRAMSWPKSCSRRGRLRMPCRGVGAAAAMVGHGCGVKRWAHTSGLAVYLGCATAARRFLGSVSCRDCRRPISTLGLRIAFVCASAF